MHQREIRCKGCYFWDQEHSGLDVNQGKCHFRSDIWPKRMANDWCGYAVERSSIEHVRMVKGPLDPGTDSAPQSEPHTPTES